MIFGTLKDMAISSSHLVILQSIHDIRVHDNIIITTKHVIKSKGIVEAYYWVHCQ